VQLFLFLGFFGVKTCQTATEFLSTMIWKLVKLQQFHFSTFSTTNIDFIDPSIIVNVVSQKIDVLSFNEAKSTKFNVELF